MMVVVLMLLVVGYLQGGATAEQQAWEAAEDTSPWACECLLWGEDEA
jgi:hypothetical protein